MTEGKSAKFSVLFHSDNYNISAHIKHYSLKSWSEGDCSYEATLRFIGCMVIEHAQMSVPVPVPFNTTRENDIDKQGKIRQIRWEGRL